MAREGQKKYSSKLRWVWQSQAVQLVAQSGRYQRLSKKGELMLPFRMSRAGLHSVSGVAVEQEALAVSRVKRASKLPARLRQSSQTPSRFGSSPRPALLFVSLLSVT